MGLLEASNADLADPECFGRAAALNQHVGSWHHVWARLGGTAGAAGAGVHSCALLYITVWQLATLPGGVHALRLPPCMRQAGGACVAVLAGAVCTLKNDVNTHMVNSPCTVLNIADTLLLCTCTES